MVIVADDYQLQELVIALKKIGVKTGNIYISADYATPYLRAQGVNVSLPTGKIKVESTMIPAPTDFDNIVP